MVDAALAERACAQLALGRLACQALGRRRQRARHERVGLRELKRLGGQQGAQSKWRMCERGDATQLTIVRLKHELRAGETKRRALLHKCNEQRTIETDVDVLQL